MCPACLCGGEAAGHNALRGSGPNRKHAFKDALTHTGSPDPRIDLVCITSSCPRQFLQSFSSQVGSGFTSLVALAFNATTIALRYGRAGAVHSIKSGHCGIRTRTSTTTLRVIAETRYLDDVDDLPPKNSTARDFFNAMLQRYPNRRLGATTLWAGTSTLYASRDRHGGEVFHESIAGWFK